MFQPEPVPPPEDPYAPAVRCGFCGSAHVTVVIRPSTATVSGFFIAGLFLCLTVPRLEIGALPILILMGIVSFCMRRSYWRCVPCGQVWARK